MQVVAGIVLPWVHNSGKASDELFHRAASALHRTQRFQPCPLRRNACLQAPAPYAIALACAAPPLDADATPSNSIGALGRGVPSLSRGTGGGELVRAWCPLPIEMEGVHPWHCFLV